jgi:hypothetical protein
VQDDFWFSLTRRVAINSYETFEPLDVGLDKLLYNLIEASIGYLSLKL